MEWSVLSLYDRFGTHKCSTWYFSAGGSGPVFFGPFAGPFPDHKV
jgi:hypothetical protein